MLSDKLNKGSCFTTVSDQERRIFITQNNELKMSSCANIMDTQLKPNPYIVEHLLYPGLYVLAGVSKIGKSWLALDLCLSVAKAYFYSE